MNLPFFVWLLLSTIWGSTWLFIKIGLEDLPPFTFAAVRFFVALVPLIFLIFAGKKRSFPKKEDCKLIAFTGFITFGMNYGLVFWGENYISSGLTAILYATHPLFGLFIAHFYLSAEPVSFKKILGVGLGILGVVVIFSNQLRIDNIGGLFGAAAIVVASLVTAYAGVQIKLRGQHLDPLTITVGQMSVGVVPLALLGLILEGNPLAHNWTLKAWLALIYLALIGSALAFVLVYWLIQKIEVTKTQLIPLASTVLAVILGRVVLHETISVRSIIGAIIIMAGLVITIVGYKRGVKRDIKV